LQKSPQLNPAKSTDALQVGDPGQTSGSTPSRAGGGVYVGKSATTGRDLYAALADESEYLSLDEAFAAAAKMRKQPGFENAHVPTLDELDVNLYRNKDAGALKGTFNTSAPVVTAPPRPSAAAMVPGCSTSTAESGAAPTVTIGCRCVWCGEPVPEMNHSII
jgi:hypothetical protein